MDNQDFEKQIKRTKKFEFITTELDYWRKLLKDTEVADKGILFDTWASPEVTKQLELQYNQATGVKHHPLLYSESTEDRFKTIKSIMVNGVKCKITELERELTEL